MVVDVKGGEIAVIPRRGERLKLARGKPQLASRQLSKQKSHTWSSARYGSFVIHRRDYGVGTPPGVGAGVLVPPATSVGPAVLLGAGGLVASGVSVGGTAVLVGGTVVLVGGTGVFVGKGVAVFAGSGVLVGAQPVWAAPVG